jgi:hypothetical protein
MGRLRGNDRHFPGVWGKGLAGEFAAVVLEEPAHDAQDQDQHPKYDHPGGEDEADGHDSGTETDDQRPPGLRAKEAVLRIRLVDLGVLASSSRP